MLKNTWFISVLLALIVANVMPAVAGGVAATEAKPVTVKSGVTSKVMGLGYCDHPSYSTVSGFAEHGKISSKEITGNVCNKSNYPVTLVFYTSDAGFTGVDNVVIYLNDRSVSMKITVVK